MEYEKQPLLIFLILIHVIGLISAQPDFQAYYCNYDYTGTYTSNSMYRTNLDTLPSFLSSEANFFNFSIGQNTDRVNVIGLCRGDVAGDVCFSCLNDSNTMLRELCPNQRECIGWYDECMLRYSDRSIFHVVNTLPNAYTYNPTNVTNAGQFNSAVRALLASLRPIASNGSSVRKFATGNRAASDNLTIYGLAECTPDLSRPQCDECLNGTATVLPECCNGRIGGRVLRPSCNFRYEIGQFYGETDTTPSSPPSVTGNGDNNTTRTVIIIVVVIVIFVILGIGCICILTRKRKQNPAGVYEIVDEISTVESLQYDFDTIKAATYDFSDANKLGKGGFGVVYKGKLQNGREIAVKRLSRGSEQGEIEFKNEVVLMANLQHRNLVKLFGFCLKETERLLIYEFVLNASLDHFIFDAKKRANLDGDTRYKIISGIARALLYLHEDSQVRIIHRDLKASNILLDAEMNPKISDFGMARMFDLDQTNVVTNRIVGTYGYMAPEYAMFGQFSVKSDVYSFGVLVLEIISGQKNSGVRNEESVEFLLSNAWRNWKEGTYTNFIDPTLRAGSGSINDLMRCIHIGLLCVQEKVANRPTMATVANMLTSFSLALAVPTEPAYMNIDPQEPQVRDDQGVNQHNQSKIENTNMSVNDTSFTDLTGR